MTHTAGPSHAPPAIGTADAGGTVAWHASLRTRLMVAMGMLVVLLLVAGLATSLLAWRDRLLAEGETEVRFEAVQSAGRIEAAMRAVRISAESLAGLLDEPGLGRDRVLAALRVVVQANPSVVGGLVALEPGVMPDGQPLAYYAGAPGRGGQDRDMQADGYDVAAQAWYRRTLRASGPWWSEPYFNETAGGRYMATLNLPLRDRAGRARGMVSLDVPVQALSVSLDGLRRTTGQRPVLFAPGGTIAVHPEPGVAFNTTLARYIEHYRRPDLAPMEEARRAGQALQFTHQAGAGGPMRYSALQPVGDTGWALQLARDQSAMLGDFTRALRVLASLGVAVALLSALAIHRLLRRITVPLEELTRSAGHFAAGEFEWPVPHDRMRDEVGVMARALERARDSIRQQMAEIARHAGERQKLQSELEIARDIQQSMLPPGERIQHGARAYLVQARLEPAKVVGGDFHSHFRRGNRLWFVVGDVSDKGIPAALFMARTLTVLEVAANDADGPDAVLAEAGRHLVEGNHACMFATVLCGVLELDSGVLRLASAGHDPPLLRRANGEVVALEVPPGAALGFEAENCFPVCEVSLAPGDTLLAFTDGVTEAFDASDEAFGEARLVEVLRAVPAGEGACDALVEAVHRFVRQAPQSDDITVFSIECTLATATPAEHGPAPDAFACRLQVPADRARLPEVDLALRRAMEAGGADEALAVDAALILEEVACNVMDHAFPAGTSGTLEVRLQAIDGQWWLQFRDDGPPYDPLSRDAPDVDAPLDERGIGGLGIHLVRTLAQEATYVRRDDRNELTLRLGDAVPPAGP
ncbi:SpoIIE family protein phosphatase [Thermomonas sp.]|uniref:SpoIIE family protein phosphatase n=1 Tax=Thermomonas sp. TaxID=1971895 RepID=UPI0035ADE55B